MKKNIFVLRGLLFMALVSCLLTACTSSDQKKTDSPSKNDSVDWEIFDGNSRGNRSLPDSPYGYELWSEGGNDYSLTWYGPHQRGGAAFRAEWNNARTFLGRVGYFWNKGQPYTYYNNVFCDFEFTRSPNGTAGGSSYLGIYGWSKNPMIEWYIVDDWFGSGVIGPGRIGGNAVKKGEFTVDGEVYFIYQATRPAGSGNIEGSNEPFPQYFSIRQTTRQSGKISITEHFKKWEELGMKLGDNMYEAKFLVEAGGGTGWFEASYLSFYTE
ncbi:MAG: glycoside hydrolase family 11 protein [Treponema sp.]|nr:glycoside hydrolase family 11 protein [Treponema sp.]